MSSPPIFDAPILDAHRSEVIDQFVEQLPVRPHRYQLHLEKDFLICVRPDGVRQWLYASPSRQKSGFARVLGRFPKMKLAQARAALHYARRFDDHDAETTVFDLDTAVGATQYPRDAANEFIPPHLINRPDKVKHLQRQKGSLVFSAIVAVLLLIIVLWWTFSEPDNEPDAKSPVTITTQSTPSTATPKKTSTSAPSAPKIDAPKFSEAQKPATRNQFEFKPGSRYLARAQLTTAIKSREPIDNLGNVIDIKGTAIEKVFFFSELSNLANQQVSHRWVFNDKTAATITFNVGNSNSWRVYSSKTLADWMSGDWRVELVHSDGTVLDTFVFKAQ